MNCENKFCIYWEDDYCTINEISLDILGTCTSCIYVDIDDKTLKEEREKALKRIDYYY